MSLIEKQPKKAKKPAAAGGGKRKKYRDDIHIEPKTKEQKQGRKITDLKNPTDVTLDSIKAKEEMGIVSGTTRESFESAKRKRIENDEHQRAVARKLIPKRENQTKNTLAIQNIHGKLTDFNETDQVPEKSLITELVDINLNYHKERATTQFPLEKLVTLGLLTAHVPSLNDKQQSMSRQLRDDGKFLNTQLEQLIQKNRELPPTEEKSLLTTKTTTTSSKKSLNTMKKSVTPGSQTSATVKLSLVGGNMESTLGYKRNSSASQKNHTFDDFDRDKRERGKACFLLDPLEDESPYGALPTSNKMYQSLRALNKEKYDRRDEVMKKQSSLVPKTDLEYINRDYFLEYRRRPRQGEKQCLNGTSCLFFTLTNEPDMRYIGRVFQTPNEAKNSSSEREGLCIDCLLCKWTLHVNEMKEKSINQSHPINHFSVLVGVGQYSQKCMLEVVFNNHPTGIIGCVPKYKETYRDKNILVTRDPITDQLQQEKYIGETGMDF